MKGYRFHDPNGKYFVTLTIVRWIDVFTRLDHTEVLIDSLKYCQKHKGLVLHAFCIMSNHAHLIISRNGKEDLSSILRDLKKFTSKAIIENIKRIKESRRDWMLWIFGYEGKKNPNNKNYQLWQQHNRPIILENPWFTRQKLNYVHENPVEAGLVFSSEAYRLSSAMAYLGTPGECLLEIEILDI